MGRNLSRHRWRRWANLILVRDQALALRIAPKSAAIIRFVVVSLGVLSLSLPISLTIRLPSSFLLQLFEATLVLDDHLLITAVLKHIAVIVVLQQTESVVLQRIFAKLFALIVLEDDAKLLIVYQTCVFFAT